MNSFDDTMHRVIARHLGRAVPTRVSSALSADPEVTVGVVTIKIVTEEQVQALAFGRLDGSPEVIVRIDPIGRDVTDLEPFANFLELTAEMASKAHGAARIWVPHAATIEALDILGHRYWKNDNAPLAIKRMGEICRIFAHEASYPGQQVIADASALLKSHMVTGLAPIEEGHLDAQLAWCDPGVRDPVMEARERIRLPASGILPNTPDRPWDDRIDRLRKDIKSATGARRDALRDEIGDILRRAVLREWRLLVEGRRAFLSLRLPTIGLDSLVADSSERIRYALEKGHFPARRPDRLAIQLEQMEVGLEKSDLAALEVDHEVRSQAHRAGNIVRGAVVSVRQPRVGQFPCSLEIDTDQDVIRFRLDDKVKVVGVNVTGIVRGLSAVVGGGTRLQIEITGGVRQRNVLSVGAILELMHEGYAFVNLRAFNAIASRQPWIFYGDAPPAIRAGTATRKSALAVASELRRK